MSFRVARSAPAGARPDTRRPGATGATGAMVGAAARVAFMLLAPCALCGTLRGADEAFEYIRRDTREATRAATMARITPAVTWSEWYLAGPFDNTGRDKHAVVYPPERTIDLEAVMPGKSGRPATWRRLPPNDFQPIDLRVFSTEEENRDAIAYLYAEITAEREEHLRVEVGSDDGLRLWLNDALLIDADVARSLDVTAHELTLHLKPGVNRLLAKVVQQSADWQFQIRPNVDPRLLAMLNYRLDLDFPVNPEAAHYRILSVLEPDGVVLEVGGLDVLADGRPVVATRRGDVWIVEGAYDDPPFDATFSRFATGLHEPLGLLVTPEGLLTVQRGELTRLVDEDGDDRADLYETVSDGWGVSGNYHEFAFGPERDGAGRLWVTLNIGFCGSLGKSIVPWRGFALVVEPDGTVKPICGGLRSPNGLGRNAEGEMFFTDNQGDWVGTNKLSHLAPGDWHGHPSSAHWYPQIDRRVPTESDFKPPAVWFPYGRMGQSASDILLDDTNGAFGPFTGQLFVGDQTTAVVMRVALELVDGAWQGACFPFRSGFSCGVNRMAFARDGSMLVGMTNRGWGSLGSRPWGLERLVYTGVMPFEVHTMSARPDGFELVFTEPVDPVTAGDVSSYSMVSFTYHRWANYGSPEIERASHVIRSATVSEDRRSVRLVVEGLRPTFVHELRLPGVRSAAGKPLLHDMAAYTLNRLPAEE